jgi:hypothetical protein
MSDPSWTERPMDDPIAMIVGECASEVAARIVAMGAALRARDDCDDDDVLSAHCQAAATALALAVSIAQIQARFRGRAPGDVGPPIVADVQARAIRLLAEVYDFIEKHPPHERPQ